VCVSEYTRACMCVCVCVDFEFGFDIVGLEVCVCESVRGNIYMCVCG